jgi:hypothetical protein
MRLCRSILKSQIHKGQFGSLLLYVKNREFFPSVYLGWLCGRRLQSTFQIMQGTSFYSVFLSLFFFLKTHEDHTNNWYFKTMQYAKHAGAFRPVEQTKGKPKEPKR